MSELTGRTVLVAGATSESGRVAARTLTAAGAQVVAVGRTAAKLAALEGAGVRTAVCDLSDETAVRSLVETLHGDGVHIDGLLHLVGGWRGGGGLAGQSDEDYRFLEGSLTALRHLTRALEEDLQSSDASRVAIVSSVGVTHPTAGNAGYTAVKAACEAWMRAVADALRARARREDRGLAAASVIVRVETLAGLEQTLADRFVSLWDVDAAAVNGTVIDLTA